MRILNEYDREITPMEVNGDKGYLELEQLVLAHHEAQDEIPEQSHYIVKSFKFADGTSYVPESEDDQHIKIIDSDNGIFDFDPCGQIFPDVVGIDIDHIIDIPYQPAQEAYDETEYIERYKLYTDKELVQNKREEKEKEAIIKFIKGGDKRVTALEAQIKELQKQLAEIAEKTCSL